MLVRIVSHVANNKSFVNNNHTVVRSAAASALNKKKSSTNRLRMSAGGADRRTFNIAIEGCCHGELDKIYSTLQYLEKKETRKVDLLICCGDFQAVRNADDLQTMAVPDKYREIMTFYKYYSGEKQAPYPTLFIGGNHEAVNYLYELFYGGWAAPNIYFLGYSGVVKFGGHRIAGWSGTWSEAHYNWGHWERAPYTPGTMRSGYHVRKLHTHRLMQLQEPVDLFLSHDWPLKITKFGDSRRLFAKKPYFQKEAERDELGSPPNQELLEALKPRYWFSAHLHCKFPAIVPHPHSSNCQSQQQQQQQWQGLGDPGGNGNGSSSAAAAAAAAGGGGSSSGADAPGATRFLALDKCLPGRDFLQILELDVHGPLQLEYDPEWLAILRSTHHLMSLDKFPPQLPHNWGGRAGPKAEDRAFVDRVLSERGGPAIPSNFQPTGPSYNPAAGRNQKGRMPTSTPKNPQTVGFLEMLGLEYNLEDAAGGYPGQRGSGRGSQGQRPPAGMAVASRAGPVVAVAVAANPEEIALDDSDEDMGEGEGTEAVRASAVERATAVLAAAGARVEGAGEGGADAGVGEGEPAEEEEIIDDGVPDSDDEDVGANGS